MKYESEINESDKQNQNKVLPGQMRYEELLINGIIQNNDNLESQVINGQLMLEEMMKIKMRNKPIEKHYKTDFKEIKSNTNKKNKNKNSEKESLKKEQELENIEDLDIIEDISQDEPQNLNSNLQGGNNGGEIIEKSLDEVLHHSMIPYTEYVVMDRALPRVEDGLKPVQRRILYSMLELGVTPDKPFRKSARIVGDCMGKYHPHGDSSVYDAMVRMSQNFSMSAPLIWGHGNFGSVDGDSAAAMRYTEAKLHPLAMELLRDLDKNTVKWSLNFDDTLKEPDMLPGRYPNLLVNGASGIAVGLATNIPPHNISEVIDGTIAFIDNPKITLDEVMKYIKAPDFPTGGLITADEDVKNAYKTGKGKLFIRAKIHLESKGDKKELVITELPYQVNKANLLQKIVELKSNGKNPLSDITEIRDESDRSGMRAVIRLKKEANPNLVLEYLYKSTNLQVSFAINMVAISDGKPKLLGLLEIISYYVEYQREIIFRRTKFDLDTAKERAHIVEGILIAIKNIDEVIKIIKKSSTTNEAKSKLREKFLLSDKQAQAILDMRLARLVNLEVEKLEKELIELKQLITELTAVINSKKKQYDIVKKELIDLKKRFGIARRSEIIDSLDITKLKEETEIITVKNLIIGITAENTVKNIAPKNYSMAQKEITDNSTKFDVHKILLETKSDKKLLFFFKSGYCVKIEADKIPDAKWRDKGFSLKVLDNNVSLNDDIAAVIELPENLEEGCLIFVTNDGYVKKSLWSEYNVNKSYYQAIKLKDNDNLFTVEVCSDNSTIALVSQSGMTLNISSKDIPLQGRISQGVIGINLEKNETIIFAGQMLKGEDIIVVTDKGFVKKVCIDEFEVMPRNRKGLRIISFSDNGKKLIFGTKFSSDKILITQSGLSLKSVSMSNMSTMPRYHKGEQKFKQSLKEVLIYNK